MGMSRIRSWFERGDRTEKPPEPEPCKHDWQVVHEYNPKDLLEHMIGPVNIREDKKWFWGFDNVRHVKVWAYDFDLGYGVRLKSKEFYVQQHNVNDMICLECGECRNGKQLFVDKVMQKYKDKVDRDRRAKERQELAEKMWKERGCGK
jgi:hypothetical protein